MPTMAKTNWLTVRLVEDNEDIVYLLSHGDALEQVDLRTTTRNFEDLLRPEPWQGVDVALVDYMLGEITGLDILRYLKGEHPRIRRVLFTAVPPDYIDERVKDFADAVVSKPAGFAEIERAIRGADA